VALRRTGRELVRDVLSSQRVVVVLRYVATCTDRVEKPIPSRKARALRNSRTNEQRGIAGQHGLSVLLDQLKSRNRHTIVNQIAVPLLRSSVGRQADRTCAHPSLLNATIGNTEISPSQSPIANGDIP